MAIKVKRRASRHQEAKQPDQIYTFNERVFNYVEQNKVPFGIGLGAVLIVVVAVSAMSGRVKSRNVEAGSALLTSTQLLEATITEEPVEDDPQPFFASIQARSEAVRQAVADEVAESDAPIAASLLDGSAATILRDMVSAQQRYATVSERRVEQGAATMALQGLAAIQASTGDLEAARGTLSRFAETSPALQAFAELELARLTEASGDGETAYTLYRQLAARYGEGLPIVASTDRLADYARQRAALLEVALGITPEPDEPAPTEDEEGSAAEEDSATPGEGTGAGEGTGEGTGEDLPPEPEE